MRAHGFRWLFVVDALGLFGVMSLINLVRFGVHWPTYGMAHYVIGFSIAAAIHVTIAYLAGLYEREPLLGQGPWATRVVLAMAIGVGVDGSYGLLFDRYLMPRINLAALLVLGSLLLGANRVLSRWLALRRQGPSRVALVGSPDVVAVVARHLADSPRTVQVVCTADDTTPLVPLVREHQVTDVLLLDVEAFGAVFPSPLAELEAQSVGALQRVSAHETLLGLQSVREVAGMPFVRLRVHTMPDYQHHLKRAFDVVALVLLSPVAVPLVAIVALYVRVRAGAPVLYRQARVGRDGAEFSLVKFRTMRTDAESSGAQFATEGDPRVVPGLRWLRSTRLDELPQLWNVLRGEMSLVGPRPERPEFTAELVAAVPGYARRFEVRPGITGLAQVRGRYHSDATIKIGYDLQYLVNWSPVLDLQILARTVWVIAMRRV
jgi:exopolysaccharide biosynthesis polyprenyl glycosylphosphotransferase